MRQSKVLSKLRAGETIFCVKSIYAEPDVVEMMGYLGVDVVWICNEHIGIGPEKLKNVMRAGRAGGADIMLRRAFGNYDDLIQPLEMGASGLMIPHCKDAEMAREIVRQTRFHPVGRRGVDGVSADSLFGTVKSDDYMKEANRETFLMVQIEDEEGLENLEEIAAVEGIDLLFVGPADLSHSLGCPGDFKNPQVRQAIDRAVAACAKHGKWCGTSGLDLEYMAHLSSIGVKFITFGSDYGLVKSGVSKMLEDFKKINIERK